MCGDYRALNDCTPDASGPIPNIAEMLRRIGSRKPKIFGIMDLTQGYHLAPLNNTTKAYTAFITTAVLVDLTYMICPCEMCIDDCSVIGDTNIAFVSRLRLVFEPFRKHKLYLEANKCYSGFKELEFVGKVLSEEGLQISRTKIQSILDFPLPTVGRQLKSFLGTVNYLRDFVRNHSIIVKPLHALMAKYDKTRRIV